VAFRFEREDGTPMAPDGRRIWHPAPAERVSAWLGPELSHEPLAARARDGGRFSMGCAISVLCDSCHWGRQRSSATRAGPDTGSPAHARSAVSHGDVQPGEPPVGIDAAACLASRAVLE
jgi:hypothetical protein